ncbi:MAG TPA: glycoside hydrolase family 3 C-terminal domain-containing protein, partial [Acidimicrobiales bacterium]|nr:glycoside hydrolase family 3 C-terminal domain-containing protein [Acidimicrobiales bacterium]
MGPDGRAVSGGRRLAVLALAVVSLILILVTGGLVVSASPLLDPDVGPANSDCPWVAAARAHTKSPAALAAEVVKRMTLQQKASFVVLANAPPYENVNSGIPSLCIPSLTLTDGPDGIAGNATGATQLPAAIGLAASFDPAVTDVTGQVEGAEARTKGLDVVQGPELNLARVPTSGRTFEAFGEDPYLAGVMGTANVEGIQSQAVMAEAKHFTAYNQENDRVHLNEVVSPRTLEELYDAPFATAVQQGHVASVMCSYGSIDGTNACSNPALFGQLRSWGFQGFVRSDLTAVVAPAAAFRAGLDLLKPARATVLARLVGTGTIPMSNLNSAVESTLRAMFAYGLIAHPRPAAVDTTATSPAHSAAALWAAEESMVLLKNNSAILPLSPAIRSVAVIGADAGGQATTSGRGSSQVRASAVSTPISALRSSLAGNVKLSYTPADSPRLALPPIPAADLIGGTSLPSQTPVPSPPGSDETEPGKRDLRLATTMPAAATASAPGAGPGWASWTRVLRVPRSGTYEFSVEQDGDTWLSLDGRPLIASAGLHGRSLWSTTTTLTAGRHYRLTVDWLAVAGQPPPQLGFADVSPEIAAAVAAARHASVAVVFAGVSQTESVDRPSLSLPGDADALISAVARANPRTVVVLNTGGAVLMPWIGQVAAVLEAWYPGQEDGLATAAVLEGKVDPAGHLPLTFPAVSNPNPVGTPAQYPGVDGTVQYTEGLDIGYRWYEANGVTPLFPFGYGLSYTSFTLSGASVSTHDHQAVAAVTVTNVGHRPGTAVVQAYLHYPAAAGEPPEQLRAFDAVSLRPSQSKLVHLTLPASAFQAYLRGAF